MIVDVRSADSGPAAAPGCTPSGSKGSTPFAVSAFVAYVERLEGSQALIGVNL